jgi:hypothetical protein
MKPQYLVLRPCDFAQDRLKQILNFKFKTVLGKTEMNSATTLCHKTVVRGLFPTQSEAIASPVLSFVIASEAWQSHALSRDCFS